MPVSRKDVAKHLHELGKFYKCLTKVGYESRLIATKFAYSLEQIRTGRVYDIYECPYCGTFHIGRKKPHAIGIIIKRDEWIWNRHADL
jgi:rubrerythrin